jgi:hypothetical protein
MIANNLERQGRIAEATAEYRKFFKEYDPKKHIVTVEGSRKAFYEGANKGVNIAYLTKIAGGTVKKKIYRP